MYTADAGAAGRITGRTLRGCAVAAMVSEAATESTAGMGPLGYNVQALSETGVSVPAKFMRPAGEQETITTHDDFRDSVTVPVIDLASLHDEHRDATMAAIASACQNWGFFQILNHGIPLPLKDEAYKLAREFFELPQQEKEAYARDPSKPFCNGYGRQFHLSAQSTEDWHDVFFHYLLPLSLKHMDSWPHRPAACRETMEKYGDEVLKLTDRILDIFCELLGLKLGYLKEVFGEPMLNVRLNFYPACPEPKKVLGLRPHSDPNVMTVLVQDQIGGLQVKQGGRWVGVPPVPGALVVNLGDQMQIVSNDRFQSVEHRVVTNQGSARLSVTTFRHPSMDAVLGPAPELVDASHPALYPTTGYAAYRAAFHSRGTSGKVLSKDAK